MSAHKRVHTDMRSRAARTADATRATHRRRISCLQAREFFLTASLALKDEPSDEPKNSPAAAFKTNTPGVVRQLERSSSQDRRLRRRVMESRLFCSTDGPPPALGFVRVVLVSPKRAISIGMVARACASFEVGSLMLVNPRVDEDQVAHSHPARPYTRPVSSTCLSPVC